MEIDHAASFAKSEDMTLFHVKSESLALAMTVEAITDKTEAYLTHFSDYAGAKGGENMEILCSESEFNWLDPADRCIDNWPVANTLEKCAIWAAGQGNSPDSYHNKISDLFSQSYDIMRAKPIPQDDYCGRKGSQSGKYLDDLLSCAMNQKGTDGSPFLKDAVQDKIQKGIENAATELAQAWLDSTPSKGDSCYKSGKVQQWMDMADCLLASGRHNLCPPDAPADLFPDHMLEGKVAVQREFLNSPQPSNQQELCGWYLDCAEMHTGDTGLTRDLVEGGDQVAQDLETLAANVRSQCLNLWDVTLELTMQNHYEFSGIDGYDADYTVTVEWKDIPIEAERDEMQTAQASVNELSGVAPGSKGTDGETLQLPFLTKLSGGDTFIQMSFMQDQDNVSAWSVTDNGSQYNCEMEFSCGSITDFEVRKNETTNSRTKIQFMVMRSRAEQELSWAGLTLPKNTGYLIWRMENLVDYCQYDSEEGEWDCDRPTMGTVAEPRPGTDSVVSDALVPDHHFFNAYLTPERVKKILDREGFSYTLELDNDLSINDGGITDTQHQTIKVTLTPK